MKTEQESRLRKAIANKSILNRSETGMSGKSIGTIWVKLILKFSFSRTVGLSGFIRSGNAQVSGAKI